MLHIISHGEFSWGHPEASGIELAGDEILTLSDIANEVDLPENCLVTLSACEVGLNEYQTLPEESYGLPAAFLSSGANRVVSALWPVSDIATKQLMNYFYEHLSKGQSASKALQKAQLQMRQGYLGEQTQDEFDVRWGDHHVTAGSSASNGKQEVHPFFWAAFICFA